MFHLATALVALPMPAARALEVIVIVDAFAAHSLQQLAFLCQTVAVAWWLMLQCCGLHVFQGWLVLHDICLRL